MKIIEDLYRASTSSENYKYGQLSILFCMAKRKKGVGFHSAAGLVRYFDAEEKTALKISPWFVVAIAVGTMIAVILAEILYPLS